VTVVAGLDVQSIDEVGDSIARFGDRYCHRLFTNQELAQCEMNGEDFVSGLALRFAAKEAVLKVLRPRDRIPPWRSIEIRLPVRGIPGVLLSGDAAALAMRGGVEDILLSVSSARGCAMATAIAEVRRPEIDGLA
jgi:holo-[acyl-carrier protein] synthase